MYFQRKVQTFYLLRESVNAILYSTKSGKSEINGDFPYIIYV